MLLLLVGATGGCYCCWWVLLLLVGAAASGCCWLGVTAGMPNGREAAAAPAGERRAQRARRAPRSRKLSKQCLVPWQWRQRAHCARAEGRAAERQAGAAGGRRRHRPHQQLSAVNSSSLHIDTQNLTLDLGRPGRRRAHNSARSAARRFYLPAVRQKVALAGDSSSGPGKRTPGVAGEHATHLVICSISGGRLRRPSLAEDAYSNNKSNLPKLRTLR